MLRIVLAIGTIIEKGRDREEAVDDGMLVY
jgi:hypothetical protein